MIDEDILKDFLVEAKDGIAKMEEEFIELEKDKGNLEIIKSLFRTMHSLKGASGFFGFKSLEGIAHFAEDILGKVRDGEIEPTEEVIDILLKCLDEIKYIVAYLEENKTEPVEDRILDFLVDLSNFTNKLKKKGEVQPSKEAEKGVTSEVKPEEASHKEEPLEEKAKTKEEPEVEEKVLNENVLPEERKEAEKEEKTVATPQIQLTETHIKVDIKLLDSTYESCWRVSSCKKQGCSTCQ